MRDLEPTTLAKPHPKSGACRRRVLWRLRFALRFPQHRQLLRHSRRHAFPLHKPLLRRCAYLREAYPLLFPAAPSRAINPVLPSSPSPYLQTQIARTWMREI